MDVQHFAMPSITMVTHQLLKGRQSSKLPKECIPLYLNAIDKKQHQMRDELTWFQKQYDLLEKSKFPEVTAAAASPTPRSKAAAATPALKPKKSPTIDKKRLLGQLGCICHMSDYIKINVSDSNVNYYYPNMSGPYEFSGKTYGGKPYYVYNATKSLSYFVYFYEPKNTWYIDDNLGDSSPKLAMDVEGANLRKTYCPGDYSIVRIRPPTWSYVKNMVWNSVQGFRTSCGLL